MTDDLDARRKRLMFRCRHMGTAENDLIFGGFAKASLGDLNEQQIGRLEALLKENDNDLYNWVTGVEPPPEAFDHDVMAMLKAFRHRAYS